MSPASDDFSTKFIYGVIRRRAPTFAVVFAVLFTIIAAAQYYFVRHGIYKSAQLQLQNWADQVASEIAPDGNWDLTAYRQSEDIQSPHIFVFTSDGVLVEGVGFISGLVGPVKLLDDSIFAAPKTVNVAETGEIWREFAVKVKGGVVALGILNPQDVTAPDEFLKRAANKFGITIEDAVKVQTRQIPSTIDYAVIDDSGTLLFEADWFPVKVHPESIAEIGKSRGLLQRAGKSYLLASKLIPDSRGNATGTVVIPKEVTGEQHVIHQHIVFNAIATLASWLAALAVVTLYLALDDWRRRPQATSLEDALKAGESSSIEFKEGRADAALQRAIAAFANTNSGTIFLGVNNNGQVVGIDCNTPEKKDQELHRIGQITSQAIRPAIQVEVDFVEYDGKTVVRIFVPRGRHPLYYVEHEIYVRQQSASARATPEQVEHILTKFFG